MPLQSEAEKLNGRIFQQTLIDTALTVVGAASGGDATFHDEMTCLWIDSW
jgi:hypothetical protein